MAETPNKLSRTYYPGLDTLRGLAILMVLVYHNFNILPLAVFGSLGVDLFFVLSGFLITAILLRAKDNQYSLRNFYIRRVLRIFPVYFLTLFFLIFALPALCTVAYDVQYYKQNQYWFYLFVQNFLFILQPLEKKNLLNHFWSLAIEEQFYLLWPMIIFFTVKTTRLIYVLLGIFILVFSGRLALICLHTGNNLFFIFSRFDGVLVGCILAIYAWKGFILPKRLLIFILIILASLNMSFFVAVTMLKKGISYFPFCGYTTFAVLFGLLTYYIVYSRDSPEKSSLLSRVLQFFGKISYGLYVYHWPVFVLTFPAIQTAITHYMKLPFFINYLFAATITTLAGILLSMISYRYFEKIFLSLKTKYHQ